MGARAKSSGGGYGKGQPLGFIRVTIAMTASALVGATVILSFLPHPC
jgi:hypothetical protein